MTIDDVRNYETNSPYGFNNKEQKEVLKHFPNINMKKYNNALMGCTCMSDETGLIMYHCDIVKAIQCGIENRELRVSEWD